MNENTRDLLLELEAILEANSLITFVGSSITIGPLASEPNDVAAYITLTNSVPRVSKGGSTGIDAYDIHTFFMITINVDCSTDKFRLYDVVDSIQRSLLNDSGIWTKLIDRDVINIEFDNAEFYPKRSAMMAIEAVHRMTCN